MLSQYFGNFLLNKGYISRDALNEVLSTEKKTRIKLGVLAINSGLMTAVQVEDVHELQKQLDQRFGEIAIEKKYLTEDSLGELLKQQKSSQLELGQVLVEHGYMNMHVLEKALNDYKSESNLSDAQYEAIKSGNVEDLVEVMLNLPDVGQANVYMEYISLYIRNIIRFIDSAPVVKVVDGLPNAADYGFAVRQKITGDQVISTQQLFDKATYLKFACKYAEMTIEDMGELANASVTEYLNLHNGLFVINMSDRGVKVQLAPPEAISKEELDINDSSIMLSIDTDLGDFYLVVTPGK